MLKDELVAKSDENTAFRREFAALEVGGLTAPVSTSASWAHLNSFILTVCCLKQKTKLQLDACVAHTTFLEENLDEKGSELAATASELLLLRQKHQDESVHYKVCRPTNELLSRVWCRISADQADLYCWCVLVTQIERRRSCRIMQELRGELNIQL